VPTAKGAMVDQVLKNGKIICVPNESERDDNQLHHLGNGTSTDCSCSFLHHLLTENVSMSAQRLGREGKQLHHLDNGNPTDCSCSFLHHLFTENVSMAAWVLMSCAEMRKANLGTKARRFL
jgi:hypothetical protein